MTVKPTHIITHVQVCSSQTNARLMQGCVRCGTPAWLFTYDKGGY